MSLANWLMLFTSLSLFSCATFGETKKAPIDAKVWIVDTRLKGAWGQTRYGNDTDEFKDWTEMENFFCFSPTDAPQFLRSR